MNSMQPKRKMKKPPTKRKTQTQTQSLPSAFNVKIFIAMGLLLVILLMKKYDLSVGQFDVDSIYDVVYHNEDLSAIKKTVFFFVPETTDNTTEQTTNEASKDMTDNELTTEGSTEGTTIQTTEGTTGDVAEPTTDEGVEAPADGSN